MNVQPNLRMDKAAFLAWAEGREQRVELVEGRIVMMVGANLAHGLIAKKLTWAIDVRLDASRWLSVPEFGVDVGPESLRYPDVVIVPAETDRNSYTVAAPAFVAEVLSPSSITVDLGDKAAEYLRLASLVAYLVLSQDEAKAWLWVRGAGGFSPGPEVLVGKDATVAIPQLGLDLPMAEIYAGVVPD